MNKDSSWQFDDETKTVKKSNGEVVGFSERQWEIVVDLLFQAKKLEEHFNSKIESQSGKKLIECCELRGLFKGAFENFFKEGKHSEEQDKAFNWMFFLIFSGLKDGKRLCQMCLAYFLVYEKAYYSKN